VCGNAVELWCGGALNAERCALDRCVCLGLRRGQRRVRRRQLCVGVQLPRGERRGAVRRLPVEGQPGQLRGERSRSAFSPSLACSKSLLSIELSRNPLRPPNAPLRPLRHHTPSAVASTGDGRGHGRRRAAGSGHHRLLVRRQVRRRAGGECTVSTRHTRQRVVTRADVTCFAGGARVLDDDLIRTIVLLIMNALLALPPQQPLVLLLCCFLGAMRCLC